MDWGHKLGAKVRKKIKLHRVRENTQDQPGVVVGGIKQMNTTPDSLVHKKKSRGKMQPIIRKIHRKTNRVRNRRLGSKLAKYSQSQKHLACPWA